MYFWYAIKKWNQMIFLLVNLHSLTWSMVILTKEKKNIQRQKKKKKRQVNDIWPYVTLVELLTYPLDQWDGLFWQSSSPFRQTLTNLTSEWYLTIVELVWPLTSIDVINSIILGQSLFWQSLVAIEHNLPCSFKDFSCLSEFHLPFGYF